MGNGVGGELEGSGVKPRCSLRYTSAYYYVRYVHFLKPFLKGKILRSGE